VVPVTPDTGQAAHVDGRRVRWAAHRTARRDALVDAAIEAVTRFGADVGMDQLAAVARTSKPVIYRYFTDKNDLYGAVGTKVVTRILAGLPEVDEHSRPREIFTAWVDAYLGFISDNPALYHFIARYQPPRSDASGKAAPPYGTRASASEAPGVDPNRLIAVSIGTQLAHGLELVGLDPQRAQPWGEATLGFVRAAGLWWLDHSHDMTRAELTEYLTTLLWDGAGHIYAGGHGSTSRVGTTGTNPSRTCRADVSC
jgi:AcrR family transcriptional regulator